MTAFRCPVSDTAIRNGLMALLKAQDWTHADLVKAIVNDGIITLWSAIDSEMERTAIRVAAEATPGVRAVNDHMVVSPLLR